MVSFGNSEIPENLTAVSVARYRCQNSRGSGGNPEHWACMNYLCNQCLSPLKLWVWTRSIGEVYLIQPYVIKLVNDLRQDSGFLRFHPPIKLTTMTPWYNWNIVESGIKQHKPYGHRIYKYLCNLCLSPLMLWVRISIRTKCTTLCDKVGQRLATGQCFYPGPPSSKPLT